MAILDSYFVYIAMGLLLFFTIYSFIKYDIRKLLRISKSFSKLCQEIERVKGRDIENLKKINALFNDIAFQPIKDIWTFFYDDYRSFGIKEKSPNINEYFRLSSAVIIPAARKRVEVIPGLITMLGILGTFIKIAIGLENIDFKATGQIASQNTLVLLDLAVSAFSISIAAIALSVVFQIFDRYYYQAAVTQLNKFTVLTSGKIPMIDDSMSMETLIKEQQNENEKLHQIGNDITSQLSGFVVKDLVPYMNKTFEEAVKNHIAPSVKTISDLLFQISLVILDSQTTSMQQLVDSFVEKMNFSLGAQFKELGESIKGMIESQTKAEQNAINLYEVISQNVETQRELQLETNSVLKLFSEYHEQVKNINGSFLDSIQKMTLFNDELRVIMEKDKNSLDELKEQRAALQNDQKEYFETMDTQVRKIMEDLSIQLDAAFSRFSEITTLAFVKIDDTMNASIENISGNMKSLFDNMDDHVRDISLYAKGLSEEVNELNGKLENSVNVLGQQMNLGVVTTLNSFDDGLSEICNRLGNVIADVKGAIEDLPLIVDSIHKAQGVKISGDE